MNPSLILRLSMVVAQGRVSNTTQAEESPKNHRRPLPQEQRALHHDLAKNHQKPPREVTLPAKGSPDRTTALESALAKTLKSLTNRCAK